MQFRIDAFPWFSRKEAAVGWQRFFSVPTRVQETCHRTGKHPAAAFVLHIWDRAILLTFQRRNQLLGL